MWRPCADAVLLFLQAHLQSKGIVENGLAVVTALLHFESFYSRELFWGPFLETIPSEWPSLPYLWSAEERELLSLARLDMGYYSQFFSSLDMLVREIELSFILPNVHLYNGLDPGQISAGVDTKLRQQLTWALATVIHLGIPSQFEGDSVALCPLLHLAQPARDAKPVQATAGTLQLMGTSRHRETAQSYVLDTGVMGPGQVVMRKYWNDTQRACSHETFARHGMVEDATQACVAIHVTIPAVEESAPALVSFRAAALVTAGLHPQVGQPSEQKYFLHGSVSEIPPPLLRTVRMVRLQFADAEYVSPALLWRTMYLQVSPCLQVLRRF